MAVRNTGVSTILLVGGAGYIGSVLARELLDHGYRVRVLDRLYYGDQGLASIRDRIELVVADVRNIEPAHLAGVDGVINVSGLSNDPTADYNPSANYEMNTVAALRLAELAREMGVRRYVLASSCSIYDRADTDERKDVVFDEDVVVCPRSHYAKSKYEAEQRLLAMAGPQFTPVCLRKGTVFGMSPRLRFDLVVNTFVRDSLVGGAIVLDRGGEMWRPLVHVHDAARAYVACVTADEHLVSGQVFNVTFCNMRVSELALRVRATLGTLGIAVEVRPKYDQRPVRSYCASNRKIERVLGFKAAIPVEEGVRALAEDLRTRSVSELTDPRLENLRWLRMLEEAEAIFGTGRSIFAAPAREPRPRLAVARASRA